MKVRIPGWAAGLIGIASVGGALLFSGTTAAFVLWARWWAVPALFLLYTFFSCLVFALVPSGQSVGKRFGFDTARFEKGIWKKAFDTGWVIAVQLVNLLLGPIAAALAIRFLGLSGIKAWVCVLVTNAVASTAMVSAYLGAGELLRSIF